MARQGLTPKQRLFVREYLVDLNATQAAIRAGFSPEWASRYGSQLLGKTRIKKAVREAQEVRAARVDLTADQVVRELALVAFSTILDYTVEEDSGRLRVRPQAAFGADRAVASIKQKKKTRRDQHGNTDTEYDTEIRLWDKLSALKTLAQHLGLVKPLDLPPLETVFASLPAHVADGLRKYLAAVLSAAGGGGTGGPAAD